MIADVIEPKSSVIINKAIDFPMDHILRRYALDNELDWETAKEHEREVKRYLALCAINPQVSYGMKGQIDELWHTFIMFTREYQKFCREVAGSFIHHVPNVPDEFGNKIKSGADDYIQFLNDYEIMFGEEAPKHLWPRLPQKQPISADCGGDISCAGCKGCTGCQSNRYELMNDVSTCTGCTSCTGCNNCGGHSE
jgi:hypothetical protein